MSDHESETYIHSTSVYSTKCVTHALNQCPHGNYACPTDVMLTKDLEMGELEEGFDFVRCYSVKLDYELPDDLTPQQLLHLLRIPDGRVIGGGVGGVLIASSPVQVTAFLVLP